MSCSVGAFFFPLGVGRALWNINVNKRKPNIQVLIQPYKKTHVSHAQLLLPLLVNMVWVLQQVGIIHSCIHSPNTYRTLVTLSPHPRPGSRRKASIQSCSSLEDHILEVWENQWICIYVRWGGSARQKTNQSHCLNITVCHRTWLQMEFVNNWSRSPQKKKLLCPKQQKLFVENVLKI